MVTKMVTMCWNWVSLYKQRLLNRRVQCIFSWLYEHVHETRDCICLSITKALRGFRTLCRGKKSNCRNDRNRKEQDGTEQRRTEWNGTEWNGTELNWTNETVSCTMNTSEYCIYKYIVNESILYTLNIFAQMNNKIENGNKKYWVQARQWEATL